MPSQPKPAPRQHFDAKTKTEICESIFSMRVTFEHVLEKYGLQQYQLYSWLGQHALSKAMSEHRSALSKPINQNGEPLEHTQTLTPGQIPTDLAQAIGAWVLRNRSIP